MSASSAKRLNTCKDFEFNEIDVFDFEHIYKPKEPKHSDGEQLKLF